MSDDQELSLSEKMQQAFDELQLKSHLLTAEAKQKLAGLEKDMGRVRHDLKPVKEAAGESIEEVGAATKLLAESVLDGFKRVRDSLKEE